MRHWVVLVLFLFALGTLRVVACGEEDRSCVEDEDCDDGNPCTEDWCYSYDPDAPITCEVVQRCGHLPEDDGTSCGSGKVCVLGACIENLCEDVVCEDGNACTDDTCDYEDGMCHFTSRCDDGDDCTEDICNPLDGSCDSTTPAEDGTACGWYEGLLGMCSAGACVGPCDPGSNQIYPCPGEPVPDYFCCPGREYCIEGGC
jgi:hypothetical protein